MPAERVRIERTPPVRGRVRVPGSKSLTNRALVAAALAEGTSTIRGGLAGDDAESMVDGLRRLGARIDVASDVSGDGGLGKTGASWEVTGTRGAVGHTGQAEAIRVDANLAGTTLRFLTAVAALGQGGITVTGRRGLLDRPVGDLLVALRACGAEVAGSGPEGDRPPVRIGRRRKPLGGRVSVDASRSSQFVSALLLVAPCFDEDLDLEVRGLSAEGFVALTLDVMAHFGAPVERTTVGYLARGGTGYRGADYEVPPDASAAAHIATLALATGGQVTIESLSRARSQPDHGFLELAQAAGAGIVDEPDGSVTVHGPSRLEPFEADLTGMPDELPNAAALAALANGTSRICGVGITRFHESDRMAAVAAELAKVGVRAEIEGDDVVVHGGSPHGGAVLSSHDDHRMVMALAALAGAVGDCALEGADAVSKTYRDFWDDAVRLGLRTAEGAGDRSPSRERCKSGE